jgi:hypothetical protein
MSRKSKSSGTETLFDRISRAKHCWLKRVMSDPGVSPSEKCFAYIVMDRLNCVTRDAWPGQTLIAQSLGKSIKTAHRVAFGLERKGHLRISRDPGGFYRYAPVLLPEDQDNFDVNPGQNCPLVPDKIVDESSLGIPFNKSSPRSDVREEGRYPIAKSAYQPKQRGLYETEIAEKLGKNGFAVLEKLAVLGDHVVERLCRAYADGEFGEREILAARLAAEQMPKKRRPA